MSKLRCRFVLGLFAFMLCAVLFVGCASKPATKLERMQVDLNTVNAVNSGTYLYKYESDILTEHLNQVKTISCLDELKFEKDFVMMAVPKEYYDDVDHEFIVQILDLLGDYSHKFYVAFLGFPDLNFLKGTQFDYGKDHFPANTFISGLHNFNSEIKQSGGGLQVLENGEFVPADYDRNMIMGFAKLIQEYNQSQ